jgi:hypothetical protein
MTHDFILYSTSACHLCEQAAEILTALASHDFHWQEIDISNDDLLLNLYGTKIPVLRDTAGGQELNWPFTHNEVIDLLKSNETQA